MLFSRLLRKEFARTALMAMVILLAILLTVSLVKLLGLAAGGTLSGSAVMAMLAFGSLTYLPVLLSASIFTALLLAMTRFLPRFGDDHLAERRGQSEPLSWSGAAFRGAHGPGGRSTTKIRPRPRQTESNEGLIPWHKRAAF